jgi:hypothetical protein
MFNEHRYIPSRRVTYKDLTGYRWKYVEIPRSLAHNGAGIPISDHEHGVIVTDRFVLQSHLEKAGLRRWTTDIEAQTQVLLEIMPCVLAKEDDDE